MVLIMDNPEDTSVTRIHVNLDTNLYVDRKITRQYEVLEVELKRLGVDVRPKFTVSPALGGAPITVPFNSCQIPLSKDDTNAT
jgi:hypothetical protein